MNQSPKSWASQLMTLAISVLVAVLLLRMAWTLLQPLLPVIAVVGGVVLVGWYVARRWRRG